MKKTFIVQIEPWYGESLNDSTQEILEEKLLELPCQVTVLEI